MTTTSSSPTPDHQAACYLDFPVRLYTALRTSRLYPITNPQVARNNELVMQAFHALRLIHADQPVSLAVATDQTLLVCGIQLPEKDQLRLQVQGLIALFNRLTLYSLAFTPGFSTEDCRALTQLLASLLDQPSLPAPISDLLDRAGIVSIQADNKRYVAVSEEEHSLVSVGGDRAGEKLARLIRDRHPAADMAVPAPPTLHDAEEIISMALDLLLELTQEHDPEQRSAKCDTAAAALAHLELSLLAKLLTDLPPSSEADQLLQTLFDQLGSDRADALAAHLAILQASQDTPDVAPSPDEEPALDRLHRLFALDEAQRTEASRVASLHTDAYYLLRTPAPETEPLPAPLSERLQQPEWAAEVLAAAVRQWSDRDMQGDNPISEEDFARLLGRYETLFSQEQQAEVARLAGMRIAAQEGDSLGTLVARRFQGLFGQQLYRQLLVQSSDILLDQTVEHLTPAQLNRMVAVLISDIPLQVGREANDTFQNADDELLRRLARTASSAKLDAIARQYRDALRLLRSATPEDASGAMAQWPQDPEQIAALLAAALHQTADPALADGRDISLDQVHRLLAQLGQALTPEQQHQVADLTASWLTELDNATLATLLGWRFPDPFGEQLTGRLVARLSDTRLNQLAEELPAPRLGQLIASAWGDRPNSATEGKAPFPPDSLLNRLVHLPRRQGVIELLAQHTDARQLAAAAQGAETPAELRQRLNRPEWAAAVMIAAVQQNAPPSGPAEAEGQPASFSRVIDQVAAQLPAPQQEQATRLTSAALAAVETTVLARFLQEQPRSALASQLHQHVVNRLSERQLRQLLPALKQLPAGSPGPTLWPDEEEAPHLDSQARRVALLDKMRTLLALHRKYREQERQKRQAGLRQGIQRLQAGDTSVLADGALLRSLPELVGGLLESGRHEQMDALLTQLTALLLHPQTEQRAKAFQILAAIALQLAKKNGWENLVRLLPALRQGLQQPDSDPTAIGHACAAIGLLVEHQITAGNHAVAGEGVALLHAIAADAASKATSAQALETLRGICTQPILEQLLNAYFQPQEPQEIIARILRQLGPVSIRFQVQALINSPSRFQRMRLLVLIRQVGAPAIALLKEHLTQNAPWFVLRNIIRLLGDIGAPEHLPLIRPYITHADLRVQQEVITSAIKLGGNDLKDFLLEALQRVDDNLKARLVGHMATIHDERFVRPLTDLLESHRPFRGKNKNELHVTICRVLGAIGSKRATAALDRIAQSNPLLGLGYGEEIRQEAARTLAQIRNAAPGDGAADPAAADKTPDAAPSGNATQDEEGRIFALASQGLKTQAMERLIELIGARAEAGDFENAERLRDRIYEINNLPLSEIIRASDLIDQAKQGAIKEEDLEIWSDLTDRLTAEEFLAMYHGFVEHSYKSEEALVVQGDKNDALFFINRGSIKISHTVGKRDLFITTLTRGQIAGENFFTPSVWTCTLTALSPTSVYVLPQSAMDKWGQQFPGLRPKLQQYYLACNNIPAILEKKRLDRRMTPRYILSRKIQVQPVTSMDRPIGKAFYADMADISLGGLAFLVRITRQENARLLLGRRMQVLLPVGGKVEYCHLKGVIIGIQPFHLLDNDFSVHLKFDSPLTDDDLQSVLG